jgi:ABC-type ATPase involved in cell division
MGRSVRPWTCQTIAQMNIPQADLANLEVQKSPVKSRRMGIVRRSHSIADVHQVTIRRNVARRMQAARERGDQRLLRALEAELREMISI